MERARKENSNHESAGAKRIAQAGFVQNFSVPGFNDSPNMLAQRKKLQGLFGGTAQLQGADEEMLQGKFKAMQRIEEKASFKSSVAQLKTLAIGKTFNNTPAARDAGKLGLGEVLTLTSAATGPDKAGEGAGGPQYAKESGTGDIAGNSYTANGAAGNVEFSVKRSDEGDDFKDRTTIEVVEPAAGVFLNVTSASTGYADTVAGAGFKAGDTEYLPNTVSFNGLRVREGEADPVTAGPFKKWANFKHDEGAWEPLDEKNKLNLDDDIQSGGITKAEFDAVVDGGPGHFQWTIPWDYKVPGKATKTFSVIHKATLAADGKVTMEKLNGREERPVPSGAW